MLPSTIYASYAAVCPSDQFAHGGKSAVFFRRNIALVAFVGLAVLGLGSSAVAGFSRNPALGSGRSGSLNDVSADSPTDAWAVGTYPNPTTGASETLVLRWNGTGWSKVASPNPGGTKKLCGLCIENSLSSVSAHSAIDAWAVGSYENPTTQAAETLVLHWNGSSWSQVASPNPGGTTSSSSGNGLSGVSANSATDVWAVGFYSNQTTGATQTLVVHWNGTSWSKVASPNPAGSTSSSDFNIPSGVSAQSASNVWAVGAYDNPTTNANQTLVLHWNGTRWSMVASPSPGATGNPYGACFLERVSAESPTDAWAVGCYPNPTTNAFETLVLHWNGTRWSQVASPTPGGNDFLTGLNGVSARSATDAWAVGNYSNQTTGATETLVLHWNGTRWSQVASPNPGGTTTSSSNGLKGVSAHSATDVWAVGSYTGGTLVLHWNGTNWSNA